ncbi:hypothetical protein G6F57_022699 [Rhizopus arrhizus]|nr:hypothetical protein G6F57_022699 [Rhizopus arrhizus]
MPRLSRRLGRGNVPASEVAAADVQHLALLDQQFHRLPDLVPGRVPVDVMHLVQVDVVGLQAAQAILARFPDVVCGQPAVIGPQPHGLVALGGQHDAVAPRAVLRQPAPDDFL